MQVAASAGPRDGAGTQYDQRVGMIVLSFPHFIFPFLLPLVIFD